MLVAEAMQKNVKTIRRDAAVQEAAMIMSEHRIGSLVVVSGAGEVEGIITERDILDDIVVKNKNAADIKVEDIMTKDVKTIDPHNSLEDAADVMVKYKIKKLPVVEKGVLLGIITASDLVKYEKNLIEKIGDLLAASPITGVAG